MQRNVGAAASGMGPGEVPLMVRFLGKLVLEILPTALASVIGAFLFAHYQFGHDRIGDGSAAPALQAAPAFAEMLQLVREEHAMVREFVLAQRAADRSSVDAAEAADTQVTLAAVAARRTALAVAAAKPVAARGKPVVAAATPIGSTAGAALPPLVIASAAPDPAPAHVALVAETLAVKDHVVDATLHAVMAIGGIPSWIGHRLGADVLDSGEPPRTAS